MQKKLHELMNAKVDVGFFEEKVVDKIEEVEVVEVESCDFAWDPRDVIENKFTFSNENKTVERNGTYGNCPVFADKMWDPKKVKGLMSCSLKIDSCRAGYEHGIYFGLFDCADLADIKTKKGWIGDYKSFYGVHGNGNNY